jgi:L-alanine-DL-glutamate epimerase-like enolase superfamily enzyme
MASPVKLTVAHESWPIAGSFTISRGSKTSAEVVHVTLESDGAVGHGECVPYARYEETIDGAMADLEAARTAYRSRLQPG